MSRINCLTFVSKRAVLAISLASLAVPAVAHHSFAMYDGTKVRTFTGVVVRVDPDANHMHIFFAPLDAERKKVLRDGSGQPVIWSVELGGASQEAQKNNISVNSFPPGTIFSVGMFPLRNGDRAGNRGSFGLFRCPPKTPPAPGKFCDSVKGFTAHGAGTIPNKEGALSPGQQRVH